VNSSKITILKEHINAIIDAKDSIISRWISDVDVSKVLTLHTVDINYFATEYAYAVLDYYVNVVQGSQEIGNCPVISNLLEYLKGKNISASELFVICTHFRKAMIAEMYALNQMSWELYDAISYVFDENFRGVLQMYSETILDAKNEIRKHENFFEQFNAAIGESALVSRTDLKGNITYANDKFCSVSGYSREELIGRNHNIVRDPSMPSELFEKLWKTIQQGDVFTGVIKNRSKKGDSYFVEVTILPLLNLEGEVIEYLAIRYEVSELIRARDTAIEAEKAKDIFLANMSHEIRTPLNAILGFVQILLKRVHDEKSSKYLQIIDSSGQTLLGIISDILDFAKIKNSKLLIEKHSFNPLDEFQNVIELFSSSAYEKEITYITFIDPNLPPSIVTDSLRIKQILSNFLSNAFKFTPHNGTIIVKAKIENSNLIFQVKDSGIGMTKEQQSRIFSAFEQAEMSTTRKHGGTGLGLSICSKLAKMLGGDVFVESEPEKGAIFKVVIPVKVEETTCKTKMDFRASITLLDRKKSLLSQNFEALFSALYPEVINLDINVATDYLVLDEVSVEDIDIDRFKKIYKYLIVLVQNETHPYVQREDIQTLVMPFSAQKIEALFLKKELQLLESDTITFNAKVLIAEDNRANAQLLSIIFDEMSIEYCIAENGKIAVEMFKNDTFDMVFMDQQMPIMGGVEATKAILTYENEKKLLHVPIVALTANALKGDREKYLSVGMDDYLKKPIEQDELLRVLQTYLTKENIMSQREIPNYSNLIAEELAAKIGLKAKHIPILIGSFTEEGSEILVALKKAIDDKDYEQIQHHAHSIKGSSGNLKFDEIYEMAKEMEFAGRDKNSDFDYEDVYEAIEKGVQSISF